MKIKKLKGGFTPYITEDEKQLITFGKRTVYIYNLEDNKLLQSVKTFSDVSRAAISHNKQLLAAKNTLGTHAVFDLESGEKICQSYMERREGEQMIFVPDDSAILDFDRDGRTMLLDYASGTHCILDGPAHGEKKQFPFTAYIQYDVHTNQIYKFVADDYGNSSGKIMVSPADAGHIAFKVVHETQGSEVLPNHLYGISLCKTHNYYMNARKNQLIMTDKNFSEVSKIDLPSGIGICNARKFRVSAGEKYVFLDFGRQCDAEHYTKTAKSLSCLFALDTMEQVAEFDYEYVSNFLMYDDDRKFVLATWVGSYLGNLQP